MMQSEAQDPQSAIESFVKNDPYVKSNIVSEYRIREFAMTDKTTDFDRLAVKFLLRNWAIKFLYPILVLL